MAFHPDRCAYDDQVLRTALWTLRQPRYAALFVLMSVIALVCLAAGTWQISRYEQSVRENDALDGNAHAAAVPLTTAMVPLVKQGPAPSRDAIRFRTVTASGSYVAGAQEFVRNVSLNDTSGYYVLTALRTADGVLLIVRGFVADNGQGAPPTTVPAPPSGLVHVTGRLQTASTKDDKAPQLGGHEIDSINPADQAARAGVPMYDTYLTLNAHQPGTSGVSVLPDPDLSNPAGGAFEGQHLAYIIQWYLFALLALAAPFVMGRSEAREAQRRFLGIDPGSEELGIEVGRGQDRPALSAGTYSAGTLAVRSEGAVVRQGQPTPEQWQHAARLADRYGRSLGLARAGPDDDPARSGPTARTHAVGARHAPGAAPTIPNSAAAPHRSKDAYQGSYNDYLWELALADGSTPSVPAPRMQQDDPPALPDPANGTSQSEHETP